MDLDIQLSNTQNDEDNTKDARQKISHHSRDCCCRSCSLVDSGFTYEATIGTSCAVYSTIYWGDVDRFW